MIIQESTIKNRFNFDSDIQDNVGGLTGIFSGPATLSSEENSLFASFNGGRITVNNPIIPSMSSFTIKCRVRTRSTSQQVIYNNVRNGGGNTSGLYIAIFGNKLSVARIDGASSLYYLSTNLNIELNKWYDIIYSYDNNTGLQSIYIDGKLDNSSIFKSNVNYYYASRFGYYLDYYGYTRPFYGDIDYFYVYNDSVKNIDYLISYKNKVYNILDENYDKELGMYKNIDLNNISDYFKSLNDDLLYSITSIKNIDNKSFRPIEKFHKFKIQKIL